MGFCKVGGEFLNKLKNRLWEPGNCEILTALRVRSPESQKSPGGVACLSWKGVCAARGFLVKKKHQQLLALRLHDLGIFRAIPSGYIYIYRYTIMFKRFFNGGWP